MGAQIRRSIWEDLKMQLCYIDIRMQLSVGFFSLLCKKYLKTSLSLFNLKQAEVEPLHEYVQRFNTSALEVPAATADTLVNSFIRAEKYMNLEDAQRQRKQKGTSGMSLEKAMHVCEERQVLARPRNAERGPRLLSSNKFCDFYQEYGHFTNDCQRLGKEVKRIISEDARIWAELTRRANPPCQGRAPQWRNQGNEARGNQHDPQRRAPRNGQEDRVEQIANHPHRGMINMISGGTTDGDLGRARKAHGRRLENFEASAQLGYPADPNISFGREDLKDVVIPHNDPLLVTLTIINYDVARIFVDTGSSVNIIFKKTLDQ
ncbi:uncharacterized protein [Henckelia pumila]|uniref:uncharacterized protein n=1 Tax=Henckelia pumila TaxID=405737 RepID=UPI003C6DF3A0